MSLSARRGTFWKIALVIAAATVGDGVFALPAVFLASGWLAGLLYFIVLGAFVAFVHVVYFKTLQRVEENERLLGLAKRHFGPAGFWGGFVIIIVGLLLSLVAILVLGAKFLALLFPVLTPYSALFVFWFLFGLPLLFSDGRVVGLELLGIISTIAIIIFVVGAAWPHISFGPAPTLDLSNAFLPFGVILFAFAGWTGVEPAYDLAKKHAPKFPALAIMAGTAIALILYALFVVGVLGSAASVTSDTLSGLINWPAWQRVLLTALGFVAVWTISMPISREIKNSLDRDLGWAPFRTKLLILLVPLAFVLAGFNNFLFIVGFVGGLFLSLQYVLIIVVGRRVLLPARRGKYFLDTTAAVFTLAALYEIFQFMIH